MSKLPEYPRFDTQTPELPKHIATAIAALSPDHLPAIGELFADPEDAFIRTRNWGFTQVILLVGIQGSLNHSMHGISQ
jgi:hypothetical protein